MRLNVRSAGAIQKLQEMTARIVVPCFNEARRWDRGYWSEALSIPNVTWVFVNDGSVDDTQILAKEVCSGTESYVLVQPRNAGKAEAVRAGLLSVLTVAADEDEVGFMDADGAFAADDVARLITQFSVLRAAEQPFDALWSSRVALAGRTIERSVRRHYMGRLAATVLSWNDREVPYDTQSGFKLFWPTQMFRQVLDVPFVTRWLFEMEMLVRFKALTGYPMRIWEEPLNAWHDVPGSKVSLKEVARIGKEIAVVKRLARNNRSSGS